MHLVIWREKTVYACSYMERKDGIYRFNAHLNYLGVGVNYVFEMN